MISPYALLTLYITIALFCLNTSAIASTNRPSLITESFYALRSDQNRHESYYEDIQNKEQAKIWNKLLIDIGIQSPAPPNEYFYSDCRYDNAINILQDIRKEFGKNNSYQKIWLQNQDRVFSACDIRRNEATSPVMPTGEELPKRTLTDYFYQQASWYFYQRDFGKANEFYEKVISVPDAPMRPYASYMILRTLRALGKEEEAYNKISVMLNDNSLLPAHSLIENYRFIIGWYGSGPNPEEHLKWLLSLIQVTPEKAADLKKGFSDYFDAMQQLDAYFPFYDENSKRVDWWLSGVPLESERMKAVRKIASQNELVDWMQAKWAYNVFDTDWLWTLHQPENAYWQQNKSIVEHAWKRWQQGDGLEWLQIVAQRVQPSDPLVVDILNAIEPYLTVPWKNETREYQEWLLSLWQNSIRLHLGRENYAQAITLIDTHPDYNDLAKERYTVSSSDTYRATLNDTMRWLLYTGHADEGRKALKVMLKQFPNSFQHWRTWLATSKEELLDANRIRSMGWDSAIESSHLWREMVNNFSTKVLYELSANASLNEKERALMSRSLVTRAILLGASDEELDKYAILAAKLNPTIRERLLSAIAQHNFDDYIAFLLRTPRFRPLPYLQYTNSENDYNNPLKDDLTRIDTYNHNENNWWCRVEGNKLDNDLFDAAHITPNQSQRWEYLNINIFLDESNSEQEFEPYFEKQRAILALHPYHQLVDKNELKELEAIPSAPEYLTKMTIKQAGIIPFNIFGSFDDEDIVASNLYNAIRTTRYGCQQDGSHFSYSHEAYKLLHKKYSDSTWAKATPYWFGCSHFRSRCSSAK